MQAIFHLAGPLEQQEYALPGATWPLWILHHGHASPHDTCPPSRLELSEA